MFIEIWGKVIFLLGALALFCTVSYIKRLYLKLDEEEVKEQQKTPPTSGAVPTPSPGSNNINEKKGKNYWWLWWLAGMIVAIILTWGFSTSWGKGNTSKPPVSKVEIQTAEPVEMELEWTLPDGELDRGLNSDVLVVKHLEVSDTSMSFDTPYSYGGSTKTANYYLEKSGDKYRGSWSQSAPRDGGDIELKQIGKLSIWTGTGTDRTGRTSSYTLRPKTRK